MYWTSRELLYRIAAFCLAATGLFIFFHGTGTREYKVLDDGSLVDPGDKSFVSFKYTKPIMSLKIGFDVYRSICYGISGFCLLLDLLVGWGHLSVPALLLSAGEIAHDLADLFVAVFLVAANVGAYPAVAYGLTYVSVLLLETLLWLGTCKFHESCRLTGISARRKIQDRPPSFTT